MYMYIYMCKPKYSLMFLIFVICTPIEEFVCYCQPLSFLLEVYVEHRCISDRVCMLAGECTSYFELDAIFVLNVWPFTLDLLT